MLQRFLPVLLFVALPGLCRAQDVPERVLPSGSQLYLSWDGLDAHRKAFGKTALGKMMRGDTGIFLSELVRFLEKQVDVLTEQVSPEALAVIKTLPQVIATIGKNGFRFGVEVHQLTPVDAEAMLVVPKAGGVDGPVFSFLSKAASLAGLKIEPVKGGKLVRAEPLQLRWYTRGDDAVILLEIATQKKVGHSGPRARFTEHDLYKHVQSFREFPSWADGYLDVAALARLAGQAKPDLKRLIADMGLDGLKNVTFHSGPDGPGEHCVLQLEMPGPRHGLLRALGQAPVKLAELPPLPADLNAFLAARLDITALYDAAIKGAEATVRIMNPNQEDAVKQGINLAEGVLGLKLRDDLFGSLDDLVVRYSSPGDGPFGFGTVYLIKVRDSAKLQGALDKLTKGLARFPFVDIKVAKRTYHGATINEIRLGEDSYRQLPSFAIHKGWLVYSSCPQPIRGFILRANGELPAWKINADLTRRLSEFPKDYVGIAVSDPRPAIKTLFSLGPTAVGMINNLTARLGPQARFDLSLLPNAHEATRHLFPNITVITDDGRRVRIETRASLLLPF